MVSCYSTLDFMINIKAQKPVMNRASWCVCFLKGHAGIQVLFVMFFVVVNASCERFCRVILCHSHRHIAI